MPTSLVLVTRVACAAVPGHFTRRGRPVVFDPVRKRLVLATPEELVRQELLTVLHERLGVPLERMSIEYPLAEVDATCRDRADIVIWGDVPNGKTAQAIAVFELKAPSKPLTGFTWDQAERYAAVLDTPFVAIANSARLDELQMAYFEAPESPGEVLKTIPSYSQMLKRAALEFAPDEPDRRLSYAEAIAANRVAGLMNIVIGLDTAAELHPFVAELDNFLLCEPANHTLPMSFGRLRVVADGGVSSATYENSSGGGFPGLYRTWLVREPDAGDQVYRIGVFAQAKVKNHPRWGNRRGTTLVLVGTDDPELGFHTSLQVNLDVGCEVNTSSKTSRITHDGRMTVGTRGAVKRADVIAFVRAHSPALLCGDEVLLGELPADRSVSWDDGGQFVLNLLEYAFLRDQLREELRR